MLMCKSRLLKKQRSVYHPSALPISVAFRLRYVESMREAGRIRGHMAKARKHSVRPVEW